MRENILNVMGVCVDRLASSAKSPFGYSVHAAIIGFSLSSKSLSIKKLGSSHSRSFRCDIAISKALDNIHIDGRSLRVALVFTRRKRKAAVGTVAVVVVLYYRTACQRRYSILQA